MGGELQNVDDPRACESAVAASLCRRSPRRFTMNLNHKVETTDDADGTDGGAIARRSQDRFVLKRASFNPLLIRVIRLIRSQDVGIGFECSACRMFRIAGPSAVAKLAA
jgi:hypothetical protein